MEKFSAPSELEAYSSLSSFTDSSGTSMVTLCLVAREGFRVETRRERGGEREEADFFVTRVLLCAAWVSEGGAVDLLLCFWLLFSSDLFLAIATAARGNRGHGILGFRVMRSQRQLLVPEGDVENTKKSTWHRNLGDRKLVLQE